MKLFIRLFISVLIILPVVGYAQQSEVKGVVFDQERQEILPFTNVTLLHPADSSLAYGGTTGPDGRFTFQSEPGSYILKISFIGFRDFYQEVDVEAGKNLKLGRLDMQTDAQALGEVQIEALQSTFRNDIDKRVFNVENSIVAEGGTAIDVLETLPSIQIDEEGGISMRGSGQVLIYINGRPTNLSADDAESVLAQFPANSVKDIELITNPSSRYDAAGAGGIINVILKKDEKSGLNGQVNASVGTRNKYTTGFSLNYGAGRFNIYSMYSFQYRERYSDNTTQRETFSGGSSRFLDLDYSTLNTDRAHLGRLGVDYNLSDNAVIGIYSQMNIQNRNRTRVYNQLFRNAEAVQDSLIIRNLYEDSERLNIETGMTFDWDLNNSKKISASVSYANEDRDRVEYFDQGIFYGTDQSEADRRDIQTYSRPNYDHLTQAQVDYNHKIGENLSFEAGVKSMISLENRSQELQDFIPETGIYQRDNLISDSVNFDQYIHAAYFIFAGKWDKLGYQVGVRGEHTWNEISTLGAGSTVTNDYFDLFPSVYLTYDIGENADVRVNYSRRINRPGLWGLALLQNVQDPTNQRIGNPYLQPEYTDSYETGIAKSWKNFFFTGTVYHRRTTDMMTRIFTQEANNVTIMSRENADMELATGLELINQLEVGNWMDATFTANLFHAEIIGDREGVDYNNSRFSWTLSLLSNFKIGKIATAQVQANYRGPMVRPQGTIQPLYGVNMGLRREILNGKGNLSLNVSDVFNTRRFVVDISDPEFAQTRTFDWETQIATLTFTYNFGGFKKPSQDERNGGMMGEDEM